ncbi:MAG: isopentenyl-diphosphate delta-isomerase [Bdellovibrionota bacterium]|nr:isopentenyl-diphosphate delta-isomerase [Bdellovibrionota bacterium]
MSDIGDRKSHHLDLAQWAQVNGNEINKFFNYEPLLGSFPKSSIDLPPLKIHKSSLDAPLWVSSMTGGTGQAGPINKSLAKVCGEFGLGLGLGSCRPLLESEEYFEDFNLRPLMGDKGVLFANFGVAQLEEELKRDELKKVFSLCERLHVDGFFIHINPLQEWYQPEGDRWYRSPLELIKDIQSLKPSHLALGVKEVGQGFGPESMRSLIELEPEVIEFGAFGGTNFSVLEELRTKKANKNEELTKTSELCFVGHTASEMVSNVNQILNDRGSNQTHTTFIISGGIRSFLEGHFLVENCEGQACYGMAKPFLEAASGGDEKVRRFVTRELEGLTMARAFLKAKALNQLPGRS